MAYRVWKAQGLSSHTSTTLKYNCKYELCWRLEVKISYGVIMEQQFHKVIFHYYLHYVLHFHSLNKRQYKQRCVSKPQANHIKIISKDKEFTNVSFCLSKNNNHNIWKYFQDYITAFWEGEYGGLDGCPSITHVRINFFFTWWNRQVIFIKCGSLCSQLFKRLRQLSKM